MLGLRAAINFSHSTTVGAVSGAGCRVLSCIAVARSYIDVVVVSMVIYNRYIH